VEGKRHGWQRLHRFQQMMTYHSMNVAAAALGSHASNLALQLQRLEADIGAVLLHRGHRYQPMTLTKRGQRLLEHLDQPEVRQLLDHHTQPTPSLASGRA
jgi:DNA-binding transcriptional LysR family regulator